MRRDFEVMCEALGDYVRELNALGVCSDIKANPRKQINILAGNLALAVNQLYRMCEDLPEEDELETEAAVKQYMKDKLTEEDLSYLRLKFGMEAREIYAI